MARIRTIKPDFWTDEKLTECSVSARLLFIGTWNFADDAGNLDRSSKQIKARVFPIDAINCEPLLQELITQGLLIEYSVSDKIYLHIKGFEKHQLINRPSKPSCPDYQDGVNNHVVLIEGSVSTHAGREGKEGKEGKKRVSTKKLETLIQEDFSISENVKSWAERKGHSRLDERLEHFIRTCKAKGYTYIDWDSAFENSIANDWAKLGKSVPDKPFDVNEFMKKANGL